MTEQHTTDDTTPDDTTENAPEIFEPDTGTPDENDDTAGAEVDDNAETDSFPRRYVEQLRTENAKYRDRAKRADTLAQALYVARVAALGRLADPTDLPYDEDLLDAADALTAAVDALLARKPHLASRRPTGSIGQGEATVSGDGVDLAAILRTNA